MDTGNQIIQLLWIITIVLVSLLGFVDNEAWFSMLFIAIFMGLHHLLYDLYAIINWKFGRNKRLLHAIHLAGSFVVLPVLFITDFGFTDLLFWLFPLLFALFFWYITYFVRYYEKERN